MIKIKSQIKIGAILSYINIGVGNIIPLIYTPIMLSLLGQNEYGLYKIAGSAISYLSLMTLGIGSSVTRFLIKSKTEGGKESEAKTFGLFNIIFNVIAILTLIVGVILVIFLPKIYNASLGVNEAFKMQILVSILIVSTAISFSSTAYTAVVSSHERFLFIQIINIFSSIFIPVFNLIVLWIGFNTIGLTSVSLCSTIIIKCAYVIYVKRTLDIKPIYKNLPKNIIPEILNFSIWVLIGSIASKIFNSTDTLIIGAIPILASAGAAIYNLGLTFPNIIFSLSQVVPGLFAPKVNKMVFSGESDETISNLVIKIGRFQSYIVFLITSGFIAFGKPFINWYAGNEYAESYWVAVIIMIPNCVPLIQSVALSVSQAKNLHKFRSIAYIIIAIINLVSTLILINYWGIIGAALCTGMSYFLGHGLIMNIYYHKKVKINIIKFWKKIIPIILTSVILCLFTVLLSTYINFYNIAYLIIGIIIYTLLYITIIWGIIFNTEEKILVKENLKSIIIKLKSRNLNVR